MMRMRYSSFFSCTCVAYLFVLFFCIQLNAQTSGRNDDPSNQRNLENEEAIEDLANLHFAVYVWPETGILTENSQIAGIPRMYYNSPEGIKRIPTARNVASPLMRYQGPMPLELFNGEWVEVPAPEGAPPGTEPTRTMRKTVLTRLNIPDSWTQAMLIVFPGQTDSNGNLRVLPIRYDLDRVQPNFVRLHNTTDVSMVVKVAGEMYALPKKEVLNFQPKGRGGHHAFRVSFYSMNERGEPQLRYTTRMVDIEGRSNLYLLYKQDKRRFRLQRVGGHEPPPTPTPMP